MNHKNDNHDIQKELDELKRNVVDLKETIIKKVSKNIGKFSDDVINTEAKTEAKIGHAIEAHPFASIGYAAAVGFIVGALFASKK